MAEQFAVDRIEGELVAFIRERFLHGDPDGELSVDTELLRLGILDSLDTTRLIVFIRSTFGVSVPFDRVNAKNIGSVRRIAAMIRSLATNDDGTDSELVHRMSRSDN
jgi:acyl carrier protein